MKRLLKAIIPTPILKRIFLPYNRFKIATIDRLLFPEYAVTTDQFVFYRKVNPLKEYDLSVETLVGEQVKKLMSYWLNWEQEEFVLRLKGQVVIEPTYGWGVVGRSSLIYFSLGVSRTPFQRKPSIFGLIQRKKKTRLPIAISLRDSGEENYFHFYNEVLAKLFLLTEKGVDVTSIPIVIAQKLWEKPYFQFFYRHANYLQSLQWVVQRDDYIVCEEAIFCKPLTHRLDFWQRVVGLIPKGIQMERNKRIFVSRKRSRLRYIENDDEIRALCQQLNIKVLELDDLPLPEQQSWFASAEIIIGIHGAGLSNIIFREDNCWVLEIFPPTREHYLPFHYMMLSLQKGFQYHALMGSKASKLYSGGFYLDPKRFAAGVNQILEMQQEKN